MVLIFTVVDNLCNFGQRLQAYALQQAFAKLGEKGYIVDIRDKISEPEAFRRFECKYLNIVKNDPVLLTSLSPSLIVLGSDWTLACNNDDLKFGSLATKFSYLFDTFPYTISYASSAGNTVSMQISRGNYGKYLKFIQPLKGFKSVSVREQILLKNAIKAVVGKDTKVYMHIDPVFLLSTDEWHAIAEQPAFVEEDDVFDFSYTMSQHKQLKIAVNKDGSKSIQCFGNLDMQNDCTRQSVVVSPQNFLWLAKNCRHFTTTSFHGVAFGIMFKKQMKILNASDSRISNIMNMFGIQCDADGNVVDLNDSIDRKINDQKMLSFEYLKTNVDAANEAHAQNIFVPCVFCCFQKDKPLRDRSASGGFCAVAAKYVLQKENSVVYGAAYDDNFKVVKYSKVKNIDDFYKQLAKSKYFMPTLPNLETVKDELDAGVNVLFIGCPCHVNALRRFLNTTYDNLTTISLVCHGVCSQSRYKDIIEAYSSNNGSKLADVDMRVDHESSTLFKYVDGSVKKISNSLFLEQSKVCEQCKVSNSLRQQMSDFFVGDFWDYKHICNIDNRYDPVNGVNKVTVLTQHGYDIWKHIEQDLEFKQM